MLNKKSVIVALVGLNMVLLLLLLVQTGTLALPRAMALAGGKAGNVAVVTAKPSGQSFDVVYVVDQATDQLIAFAPVNIQNGQYKHLGTRDLAKDFSGKTN